VAGQRLLYSIDACPIGAWRDPLVDDGQDFGSYPNVVVSDDGTEWLTHLFVLDVATSSIGDWSFVLVADDDATPGEIERIVSSHNDRRTSMTVELTRLRATFTTTFIDSAGPDQTRPLVGTVTVTCS
jgi:hypothetical protein